MFLGGWGRVGRVCFRETEVRMARWKGDWEFRNVMHHLHRRSGSETVDAESEDSARVKIRHKASRELLGTTMMHRYITVYNLRKQ